MDHIAKLESLINELHKLEQIHDRDSLRHLIYQYQRELEELTRAEHNKQFIM